MAKTHTKTQDEKILHFYYSAIDYFEKNTKQVYIILGIIAGVVLLGYFYMNNQKNKTRDADTELSNAQTVYEAGAYDQAVNGDSLGLSKGLVYIVNEYGSTQSGEIAKIMLANSYYYLRDFANAEKYYNDYSGDDEILKAAAIAGVGAVLEARSDFSGAAQQYEKAAGVNKLLASNDEYLFYAARNYSLAGDKENYDRVSVLIKADYPKSTYLARLDRYNI